MAPTPRDRTARERLANSFRAIVQPRGGGIANESDYFQAKPFGGFDPARSLDEQDFVKVFGTEEDFLKRYAQFEQRYFNALDNQVGRIKGGKVTVNMMKKRGTIDLSLLDHETSKSLSELYKRDVMRIERLFQNAGLPSMEMPSANLYRHLFKMEIDTTQGIRHPALILLNSMMFNFNPEKDGLESINLNRHNILGSKQLGNIWKNFKSAIDMGLTGKDLATTQFKPFSGMKANQKIIMFDTETTGVDEFSQVRSMSMRELTIDSSGQVDYRIVQDDLSKFDIGFKSPKLFGYKVSDLNGGTRSLNEFISSMEKFKSVDMGPDGEQFLDEATKFINRLLQADKIAGHNAGFDIKMLTDTIMAQSAFKGHAGAKKAVDDLLGRINNGNFVIDTLTSTRAYLQNQVQELIDQAPDIDVNLRSDKFVRNLMAQETLAKVHIGGGATYASVENIALNTNLFELIEKDSQAENLFNVLKKGSHIAETDVHLQSFIAKFVQSGELKIKALALKDNPATEFGDWARSIIARSSATTPTTNIASVRHLHQTAFTYLQNQGVTGVKLQLTGAEIQDFNVAGLGQAELEELRKTKGILSFGKEGFTFTTAEGSHRLTEQRKAASTIIDTIRQAAAPDREEEITLSVGRRLTAMRNRAAERILDTGLSFAQVSNMAELANRGRLQVGRSLDINDLSDAMGSIYRKLGTGISISDQTRYLLGAGMEGSPFRRGIAEFDTAIDREIAEKYARIGDPFADVMTTRGRVQGSILAEATAGIAREAGEAARAAGIASDAVAHTVHADLTSGMGISYFRSQDTTRLFDLSSDRFMATSKPMVTQSIFKEAIQKAGLGDQEIRLGLSKTTGLVSPRINVAADIQALTGGDMGKAKLLAEKIFELMKDHDEIARLSKDGIAPRTARDMATVGRMTDAETVKAVDNLAQSMMDRGLVFLQAGGKEARAILREEALAELITENDARSTQSLTLLQSALTDEYAAVSGPLDIKAITANNLEGALRDGLDSVDVAGGKKQSRVLQVVGEQARVISETEGARDRITLQLAKDKYGLPENKMLSYYLTHKTGIKATAIGVAAAGLAYLASKKHREARLYDETLAQQPTEANRGQTRIVNENVNSSTSYPPRPMDPLATAGVVGNLDRMKIGHGRMGNNKYNHLYGG